MNNNYNKDQLEYNVNAILGLEWLGIRIEDTKEEQDAYGFSTKTVCYFSVPEASTIEVKDEELNARSKTADGLKGVAKEMLVDMILKSCQAEFGKDKGFLEDVKNNISDYFKFYARIRKGEIWTKELWTKELGDNRIKELTAELEKDEYNEV